MIDITFRVPFSKEKGDHAPVISVLCSLSNDQRQKLRVAYATRHKRDLITDLQKTVENEQYAKLLSGNTSFKYMQKSRSYAC